MKTIKFIILILASLVGTQSFAAIPKRILLVGKVDSVSEKSVTLMTKTGPVTVPRSALVNSTSLKPGATISARVSWKQLHDYN